MGQYNNPYAPPLQPYPQAHGTPYPQMGGMMQYGGGGERGFWREGDAVAIWPWGAYLPDRCVKCNAPATRRMMRTLYWHDPLYYLTLLGGVLIYAIVAMATRKSASVSVCLCDRCDQRRKIGLGLAWGGFATFFVLMIVGAANASPEVVMLGSLLLMLVCPIAGGIMAKVISPKRIEAHQAWLKVGPNFLLSVPETPQGPMMGGPNMMAPYGGYPRPW